MRAFRRFTRSAILVAVGLSLVWPELLHAGTTGKIAGQVKDADSGEPLVGVNIVLEGTRLGAATDLDGTYFIINIPPGSYTMKVSMLNYATQQFTDVVVNVDQTTTINVNMQPTVIKGQEVVIKAKRPIVEPDRTFSTASVGDQDLKVMPITRVQEVIDLQAGVVDGHFRGGRSGEVVYMVDGIPVQDVYDNSQSTKISQDVVKELQVITGTFNAEYGQAMSGVVNMVTKEGGPTYHGAVHAEFGDYISSHTNRFDYIDHVSPKDIQNYEISLSGPTPFLHKLGFYVNGRLEDNQGWLYGRRKYDLTFEDKYQQMGAYYNTLPPAGQQAFLDSLGITPEMVNDPAALYLYMLTHYGLSDSAAVPMNPDRNLYLFGKFTYELTPSMKLNYISMWEDRNYKDFDRDYLYIPEGDYKRFRHSRTNSLKLTTTLSRSAFMEASFSNSYTEYKHYVYQNIFDHRYYYQNPGLLDINPSYTLKVNGVKFEHFRRYSNTQMVQGKLSWQVNPLHYLVTGANFNYNDVYYNSLNDDVGDVGPTILDYGGKIPPISDFNHDYYLYHPVEGAYFIQDKIELKSLVVNLGMRFDYFNSNGKVLDDPRDPDAYHPIQNLVNKPQKYRLNHWYHDPTPKTQLSPRLGIGYPISDRGVLHFAYGHFFQRPNYEYLYANPKFELKRQGAGLHTVIGNADLDAEKTISYEFGFQQALTEDIGVGISLYERDIRGLVGADKIVETYSSGVKYAQYINRDIAEVRGVLLSFDKRYSNNISASVDYTFQIAEGVASDPLDAYHAQEGNSNEQPIKQLIPLNWDRRHTLNVNFNYTVPDDWGASVIGTLGSGLPYTIQSGTSKIRDLNLTFENDGRKPMYANVDLNMYKELKFWRKSGLRARLQLMIRNLFDRLNENDVYGDTGRATYRTDIPESRAGEHPDITSFDTFFLYYPQYFSRPREVRVALTFEF